MKILIVAQPEFFKKLGNIKHNLKQHKGVFQTTEIGKVKKGINKEKIMLDKDIQLLKECESLLICNFKTTQENENQITSYFLLLMGIAYAFEKNIYLLYDAPNKYVDIINRLEIKSLAGNLKKIM